MKRLATGVFASLLGLTVLTGCTPLGLTVESGSPAPVPSSVSPAAPTPLETSVSAESNEAILQELVTLTEASDPGPTQNYYWDNGLAQVNPSDFPQAGDVSFSSDDQGRASVARGALTYELYAASKGSRQGDPLDPPTGWPSENPKISIPYSLTGKSYRGYFWNRSHSIGDALAGEKSYESANNFTAGTRAQNVGANQNGGMRAAEEYVEDYWKSHEGSTAVVYYQLTPLYEGNEIVPRGSIVDVLSSDGALNKEFVIVNDAEGWLIDYSTGAIQER